MFDITEKKVIEWLGTIFLKPVIIKFYYITNNSLTYINPLKILLLESVKLSIYFKDFFPHKEYSNFFALSWAYVYFFK